MCTCVYNLNVNVFVQKLNVNYAQAAVSIRALALITILGGPYLIHWQV